MDKAVQLRLSNEPCTRNDQCQSRYCFARQCTEPKETGDYCCPTRQNCPSKLVCDFHSHMCVIPTRVKKNSKGWCIGHEDCKSDEYCSQDAGCERRKHKDEPCTSNGQCNDGLACFNGYCFPKCIYRLKNQFGCEEEYYCSNDDICLPKKSFPQPDTMHEYFQQERLVFSSILSLLVVTFIVWAIYLLRRQYRHDKKAANKDPAKINNSFIPIVNDPEAGYHKSHA